MATGEKNGHESDLFEKYYGTSKPIDQQCTSTSTFSFAAKFIALPSLKLESPISSPAGGYYEIRILTKDSSEAEIAKLDDAITGQEYVFRFDITMYAIVHVAVIDGLECLPHNAHGRWHGHPRMG